MADDELLIAKESFATTIDGVDHVVQAHKTRVRRGHPLHAARPDAWDRFEGGPTIPETATAAPGEKRGAPK